MNMEQSPNVPVVLALTPAVIRGFDREQVFIHIGWIQGMSPAQLQQCKWQIALLEERRALQDEQQAHNITQNILATRENTINNQLATINAHLNTINTLRSKDEDPVLLSYSFLIPSTLAVILAIATVFLSWKKQGQPYYWAFQIGLGLTAAATFGLIILFIIKCVTKRCKSSSVANLQ